MEVGLHEVNGFGNDKEFHETKAKIHGLMNLGHLQSLGLDPSDRSRFVEMYKASNGEIWRLAIPDHAFRGYLKKG